MACILHISSAGTCNACFLGAMLCTASLPGALLPVLTILAVLLLLQLLWRAQDAMQAALELLEAAEAAETAAAQDTGA